MNPRKGPAHWLASPPPIVAPTTLSMGLWATAMGEELGNSDWTLTGMEGRRVEKVSERLWVLSDAPVELEDLKAFMFLMEVASKE